MTNSLKFSPLSPLPRTPNPTCLTVGIHVVFDLLLLLFHHLHLLSFEYLWDAGVMAKSTITYDSSSLLVPTVLGGGSVINGGLFFTPPRADFDEHWPDGWHYDDVASYYERSVKHWKQLGVGAGAGGLLTRTPAGLGGAKA